MVYRYQEDLMLDTLAVLKRFRQALPPLDDAPPEEDELSA